MQDINEIYQQHAQTVYKYLLSKTQNPYLAEELTQETFYQAIISIDRFNGKSKISTWLCAIAKNQLLVYRRKHPEHGELTEISETTPSPETEVTQSAGRVELMKKLHLCPEPYKEIIYLRIYGGLSFKEIGEIMEQSETWARVNYYRGKEKLRKELENYEK